MTKKILVTSALPYANGSLHVGHLVEYIQTDIFVRFLKLIGKDAIYCCADDTHGTPIEVNAKKQGITPEDLIAKFYKEHIKDFSTFLINFDSYYSTNSKENKEYADLIFTRLKEKGHIYTKDVEQTYCEHCERFLPDRFVKGKCASCGNKILIILQFSSCPLANRLNILGVFFRFIKKLKFELYKRYRKSMSINTGIEYFM